VSPQKKSLVQTLKSHETAIVETAAVLTASTRWVITFSPIDKTNLAGIIASMGWMWDAISAVLSISFAVVEIWATAMIMRAFNLAKDGKDKFFLGAVWFVSLVVLAMVQIPPLYASLMDVPVSSLAGWNALYVVATSVAAFVVIAGVSYADRFKVKDTEGENVWDGVTRTPELPVDALDSTEGNWKEEFRDVESIGELKKRIEIANKILGNMRVYDEFDNLIEKPAETVGYSLQLPTEPMHGQTPRPDLVETKPEDAKVYTAEPDTRIVVNGFEGFVEAMKTMNGNKPKNGNQVSEVFKASKKTGYAWWSKYQESVK